MLSILETLQYDSIYHEHLRYYLVRPRRSSSSCMASRSSMPSGSPTMVAPFECTRARAQDIRSIRASRSSSHSRTATRRT
jgi:hypothetical protein